MSTVPAARPIAPVRRSARPLDFLERIYLFEIAKGMLITLAHVVRNLISNARARPQDTFRTIEYPEMRKPMAERYKGAHRLTTRPDGKLKCVACMCCAQVCPAKCISIVAGEDNEDAIEKYPLEFTIDMLRCIYCGYCVEACPKDAIRMDTGIYEINAFTRQDMVHNKLYMVDLMDGAKPEAATVYRANPENAPAGYRTDEPPVV